MIADALANVPSGVKMHRCLSVDEILRIIACELVGSGLKATAVSLAHCCRSFQGPVLDTLWKTQYRLIPLLKCLPQGVWQEEGEVFTFQRIPTTAEWAGFREYSQRMRGLRLDSSEDPLTPEIFLALQLRTANEPFLPMLEAFECQQAEEEFIPFIPLVLSPRTRSIRISFADDTPSLAVASTISRFPMLCPQLERVIIESLERDSVLTNAVSEMLLACNQDSLQVFEVDSPLTEEAREVVYRLPTMSNLWAVIQGRTLLPPVMLPNLNSIDVEYDGELDWLQAFRGATLEKLESTTFTCKSEQIGDFLGAFASVALTTSAQNSLSAFKFYTSHSWNPKYTTLLPFKQLTELEIEFSCDDGCSSRVDDDVITLLAQAMPKLVSLKLGGEPCREPNDVTVYALITLASRCLHLSELRIHFSGDSLVDMATDAEGVSLTNDEPVVRREDCGLTHLEVGRIHIPPRSAVGVAHSLLQIFPRILKVKYDTPEWKGVARTIEDFRRIGIFVGRAARVGTGGLSGGA
ncbi:hypothetical protein BJ322DRAFT_1108227 [Thelephora terrestris]|uniref:F-box domain-containing protein n=1 Tax=Thelephora terrestris TaxID=56493 RepID=A0A9P6HG42_9AGAM|nr:hypothetical protein BJ322DRAFT_1108227 [Thelephora terrestris]